MFAWKCMATEVFDAVEASYPAILTVAVHCQERPLGFRRTTVIDCGLETQAVSNCIFDLVDDFPADLSYRRLWKPARVERPNLEAEEHCFHRQPAFLRRYAHVCGVIQRYFLPSRADDDSNHEREAIDGIDRKHKNRPLTCLLSALDGIEIDEIDLAAANVH